MSPVLPEVGDTLVDRFRLTEIIGQGGMGVVFRAEDLRKNSHVAIKVLHPELATNIGIRRRFHREASILRSLDHPGLVRVHQVRDDDRGWTFMVMELIEGETFEVWARHPTELSLPARLELLASAARALHAAHGHGIVHGDVKPANIFVIDGNTPHPQAKLVDFGLCKVEGLERLTRTGEIAGTPAYMPPELITGAAPSGPTVDIYSLGVVLYQSLTGHRPFEDRSAPKMLIKIVEKKRP